MMTTEDELFGDVLYWKGRADALVMALEEIAAMDPNGVRADDLGRAARIACEAIRADVREKS